LLITCTASSPASDSLVAREVTAVLTRRAALDDPPDSIAVSDAVALGIAAQYRSPTATGQVMDYLVRTGRIDSDELVQAARFEQGYATPEGHAALYCLVIWARSRALRGDSELSRR
jgi:hypothetical protein